MPSNVVPKLTIKKDQTGKSHGGLLPLTVLLTNPGDLPEGVRTLRYPLGG